MRIHVLLQEALRNILAGTTKTILLTLVFGLTVIGLSVADLISVQQIIDDANHFQRAGASIMTITAEGRIDGAACEELGKTPGVRAAGAIRSAESDFRALTLPDNPVPIKEVSTSFIAVLTGQAVPSSGVMLEEDAARTLGVNAGSTLLTSAGPVRVSRIYEYPSDGRRSGLGYAALIPTLDSKPFDECWMDGWPQLTDASALLLTTVTPSNDPNDAVKPLLGQLNPTLGTSFDGKQRFNARISNLAIVMGAVIGFALGFVSIRIRRMELASSLHTGVARGDLHRLMLIEALSWLLPPIAVVIALTLVLIAGNVAGDWGELFVLGVRVPLVAAVLSYLGVFSAVVFTREAHLFQYFKDR